jgi:hypothetical protein
MAYNFNSGCPRNDSARVVNTTKAAIAAFR